MPQRKTLETLRQAAAGCRGCGLYKRGTQTVFGEGRPGAKVMMVGEQPGHEEDLAGHPFVGPAGKLLDRALAAVSIPREDVYVTNVVKHFKWEPRGKRRIHAKPNQMEIAACLPWLEAELEVVEPDAVVCLGATAAQALLGPRFRVTKQRGQWVRAPLAEFNAPFGLMLGPVELQHVLNATKSLGSFRVTAKMLARYARAVADFCAFSGTDRPW